MGLNLVTVVQRKIGGSLASTETFGTGEQQVIETAKVFATPSLCKGEDGVNAANYLIKSKIILEGNPVINLWVTDTCATIAGLS